jgi:hypothetical protein
MGALAAVLLRRSRWAPWIVVLAIISTRLALDPVLGGYYWLAPCIVATSFVVAAVADRNLVVLATAAAVDLVCAFSAAPAARAVVVLVLVAAATAVIARRPARFSARPTLTWPLAPTAAHGRATR